MAAILDIDKVEYTSTAMRQVYEELVPSVNTAKPIFFWGEEGSGMGFYAKNVHEASRQGAFLKIPCSQLEQETVKQRFLGMYDQKGWLEEAHEGTIFLERISKASNAVQQALLDLFLSLQATDGTIKFPRVGNTETVEVNVRFIFSLAENFDDAVHSNTLNRDLASFLRKRGSVIHLFSLRKRREDIIPLVLTFFDEFNQEYKQNIAFIDEQARTLLTNYNWPGNIDELRTELRSIFSHYPGITTITGEHIPKRITKADPAGELCTFELKDGGRIIGKIISSSLLVQDKVKSRIKIEDVVEIIRVEDDRFRPPKFKYFAIQLKDGNYITVDILDKTIKVETSFNPAYEIEVKDVLSAIIL